jgi:acyl-CoA reductase-like NAD-dependent aldehyde dehydrogenase
MHAGLVLEPLSGALAAGNAVVVKPSGLAPSTAAFLAANLPKYLDSKAVKVVEGGPLVGEKLMEHRWDNILYTGNNQSTNRACMCYYQASRERTNVSLSVSFREQPRGAHYHGEGGRAPDPGGARARLQVPLHC